nr:hypothetical protein [Tanacetum cinerariifolium]
MMKGCFVCLIKYIVDTDDFKTSLPEGLSIRYIVWSLVAGEKEEDSFLVMNLSGKVVQYKLISKTVSEIYDMGSNEVADDYLHGFIPFFAMYDVGYKKNLIISNKVKHAAAKIGCLVLKTPFNNLGSRVRVVKALHGEDEKIGKNVQPRYPSTCLNIINEIESLKLHGIDLVSFITPKLGNGVNTSFWDVAWCGDIAFKNLVPRLYARESMKNIEAASKLSHG